MRSIQRIFDVLYRSDYFKPWQEILLGSKALQEWHDLLHNNKTEQFYEEVGERLFANKVPFVIVTEYVDEVFRHHEGDAHDHHHIKNMIAQAYLKERLYSDSRLIEIELKKRLIGTLEEKRELINAHLRWMQAFIGTILGEDISPELDSTRCHVGRWLNEEDSDAHQKIHGIHHDLHSMAQSAIRMYRREDYAYFLLLYIDILMSSYQIRDLIMNIYFSRRLTSIYRDPVTDQPNYFQLKEDMLERDKTNSLLMFNIKEFSKINMLYGHDVGDTILREITERVINIDAVERSYRVYGDEFAIMFSSSRRVEVLDTFKKQVELYDYHVGNNIIALSFYGSVSLIVSHVLERCEYGLIESQLLHGHITDVDHIDEVMMRQYASKITLSEQLRLAFMDNRIMPYFQPILDVRLGEITKYEALMRVEDLDGIILVPAQFLDVLQGMFIYPEVTKLMIQKTFDTFEDSEHEFSINLSFADIIDKETEDFIIAILKRYPEAACRCTFELLEHETIHNFKEVKEFFDLLHSYGVKIALDDFGVGYSNYDTIFKFDIDYIKIDGSLTQSILTDHKSLVLMESIITVAKELDAKTVVEFVCSEGLFDVISEMGVDFIQGFYIGTPEKEVDLLSLRPERHLG